MAENKKRGRPKVMLSDLPKGWKESMLELASEGASELEIRITALDGICHETWERLINENKEFSETVKRCRGLCQVWWEKVGRNGAAGAGEINPTTWIFNMKNRFDWRDKRDVEQTHKGSVNLVAPDQYDSAEEWEQQNK